MFVKRLRLAGFKSFADPTVLEFEPGINVIVGPNGSGKSNIADALSWVLGSQAPSSLRGASMEDVIFAGAQGRARLGLAEVELTLDNASGALPLDVSEVTISRSADRTGASEYRINGGACRLLDVQELLSDTGIGRSLHTVVGQGQLDAVLQARPEDRRAFIEEAAQIGKFRRRKDRALRKIERVDENLVRLNDVLAELGRAIRPLKRQSAAAAQYSQLTSEYTGLRQRLTATEVQRMASEEAALDAEEASHRAALLEDELAGVRSRLDGAAAEREALSAASQLTQRTAYGLARVTDRFEGLTRMAQERAALISARLQAETEQGYRERIRLLEAERERWSSEADRLATVAAELGERADAARAKLIAARAVQDEAEAALSSARGAETEAAQALVRAEGSEAAGRATLGSSQARVQAVVERRHVTERELEGDRAAIQAAENDVRTIEHELDAATEAAAAAEMRLEEARGVADGLKDQLGATQATRAAATARLDALTEVRDLVADLADAARRIDPLIVHASSRQAVATASEQEAARIVARAEADVERLWGEVGTQDEELRRLDALMSGAAERLGGFRRRLETREVELAALDEELARVRQALAAAELAAAEERAALPAFRAAVDEARTNRDEAERRLAGARAAVDAEVQRSGDAAAEARTAHERALAASLRLEEAEAGLADTQQALEGLADLRAALTAARRRAEDICEIAAAVAGRATEWKRAAQLRADETSDKAGLADRNLTSLRARERQLEQELEAISTRRNAIAVRVAEMRARTQAVAERAMEEWGLNVDDLLELAPLDPAAEAEARERVEQLDRQMKRMGNINPRAADEYAELAERESFLQEQIEDLRASKRDLMKIVRDVDATIVDVFGRAFGDVADEFASVFLRLFPGGSGAITLTDPDDLLGAGIEIEARPPGKNVRKISLLSGGERSLVALAFLFAIFRARPSPFYLLDEVEAALDDINLVRFLGLVEELETRAQVLIVTHQKRTMEAADVLYGVSMAKDGVSRVVAKRMEEVAL